MTFDFHFQRLPLAGQNILAAPPPSPYAAVFLIKTHSQTPGLQGECKWVSNPDVSCCKLFCESCIMQDRNHIAGCACHLVEPLSPAPCWAASSRANGALMISMAVLVPAEFGTAQATVMLDSWI